MSDEMWRDLAERQADERIRHLQEAAEEGKVAYYAAYREFTEDEWKKERARLVRVYLTGDRNA